MNSAVPEQEEEAERSKKRGDKGRGQSLRGECSLALRSLPLPLLLLCESPGALGRFAVVVVFVEEVDVGVGLRRREKACVRGLVDAAAASRGH